MTHAHQESDRAAFYLRSALVALIVMLPIEVSALLDAVPGTADGYSRLVVIQPFDIALATIALLGLPGAVERLRRRDVGWGTGIMLLLLAGAVVSAVFTPTWRAAALILRLAGLFVTTSFITQLSPEDRRRFVVAPLLITVGVQALIGIAQMANRGPVGLSAWGERSAVDFRLLDGFVAIKGTMIHEYVLTGVAMLAATLGVVTATRIRPSPAWLAGIALAAVPLGLTYSRMALIGIVLVIAALAWGIARDPRRYALPTVVLIVAVAVPTIIALDGWKGRTLGDEREGLDRLTTGRVTLLREAVTVIGDHALVGVGPGNYGVTVESEYAAENPKDVHAVPVLVAAEDGLVWGIALLVALGGLALGAIRAGPAAVVVFVGFLPFWAFDKFPYSHPNGLVMTALWLGMVEALSRESPTQESNAQLTAASA